MSRQEGGNMTLINPKRLVVFNDPINEQVWKVMSHYISLKGRIFYGMFCENSLSHNNQHRFFRIHRMSWFRGWMQRSWNKYRPSWCRAHQKIWVRLVKYFPPRKSLVKDERFIRSEEEQEINRGPWSNVRCRRLGKQTVKSTPPPLSAGRRKETITKGFVSFKCRKNPGCIRDYF